MFTEDQMVAWENRTSVTQTWAALQTYLTEKWLERKQYSSITAKQLQFKEAALQAAAEEESETQAMLQDQHTKQITQMEATNKTNMEAMMDKMNALVASNATRQTHQPDKKNTPLGGNVKPPGGGDRVKNALTVSVSCSTSPSSAMNWRQTKPRATRDGSPSLRRHPLLGRDQGQR